MTSTTPSLSTAAAGSAQVARPTRLTIDAPVRVFHWLFALSFAGAWLTAESERWRTVHETLGYAFGGLLLLRLVYGLVGPRQARLALLWRRSAGLGEWLRGVRAGRVDMPRAAKLGSATALLLLAVAAPLVLTGHAGHAEWLGMGDALEEAHGFLANAAMALVAAHLTLIALQSILRRRNLAAPMLTGRILGSGPDLVKANRVWLAVLLLVSYVGFVASQMVQADSGATATTQSERQGGHDGDDD